MSVTAETVMYRTIEELPTLVDQAVTTITKEFSSIPFPPLRIPHNDNSKSCSHNCFINNEYITLGVAIMPIIQLYYDNNEQIAYTIYTFLPVS